MPGHLEEVNTALWVLLKRREEDKGELDERVLSNVKDLVFPYLDKLNKTSLDTSQKFCADILESNLKEIISPFSLKLSSKFKLYALRGLGGKLGKGRKNNKRDGRTHEFIQKND